MIEDARLIPPNTCLEADLCIVGGGAAAISLALEYMKSGLRTVMVPGGGPNQTAMGIDLYRGKVAPPGSHEPLEENRLRMWGGAQPSGAADAFLSTPLILKPVPGCPAAGGLLAWAN